MNTFIKFFLTFISIGIAHTLLAQNSNDQITLANKFYQNGNYPQAITEYSKLAKNRNNYKTIANNYIDLLLTTKDEKTAKRFISKIIKHDPRNVNFEIHKAEYFRAVDQSLELDQQIELIIVKCMKGNYHIPKVVEFLISKQFNDVAIDLYQRARVKHNNQSLYALELAKLYHLASQSNFMYREYINFALQNKRSEAYVKNILQQLITEKDNFNVFQSILLELIQLEPDKISYNELLIWSYLQQNDFRNAFIQSKAIDRRHNEMGIRLIPIAKMANQHNEYADVVEIYEYLIKQYPTITRRDYYEREIILCKEKLLVSNSVSDSSQVYEVLNDYKDYISNKRKNDQSAKAIKSCAHLLAYNLGNYDSALYLLNDALSWRQVSHQTKNDLKFKLADLYFMNDQSWESILLYAQIEQENSDSPTSYRAKLLRAKLHYYNGNFTLAQSHLDILKLATTREIANDAMDLSLLIKNNTILDSTNYVLKQYAKAELLIARKKTGEGIDILLSLLNEYPQHSLTDEIYWLLADVYKRRQDYEKSITYLDKILSEYPDDILADDAFYLQATIVENSLDDTEKALILYNQLLRNYPGSKYVSPARKSYRALLQKKQ